MCVSLCVSLYVSVSVPSFLMLEAIEFIYSPETSQIQVLEEGSARTCVAVIPKGPPTLDMRVKVIG